jgi:hypothetical protein
VRDLLSYRFLVVAAYCPLAHQSSVVRVADWCCFKGTACNANPYAREKARKIFGVLTRFGVPFQIMNQVGCTLGGQG